MKDMYFTVERIHSKIEVKCEECAESGGKAEAFCRQCGEFICQECVKSHKRMRAFSSHEVSSLQDLKRKGQARELATKEPPTKKCEIHEEPLIVYCFDCNSLICHYCITKLHRDHNFEFTKVAAPDTKKELLEMLKILNQATANLSESVKDICTTKHEIEAQGTLVANTIKTYFKELQQILEKRQKELLSAASRKVQDKIDKLSVQEKTQSLASTEVQSIIDYTESFVGRCSDNEVMSMHTEIRSQIQRQIEENKKSMRSTEPVEKADMGVELRGAIALQQLCLTTMNITQLILDPAQCILRGSGLKTARVNKKSEITLITRPPVSKTARYRAVVTGHLKSLRDQSVIDCNVGQYGPGEYCIKYMPTSRGRHELTLSVAGQQVVGSPFPVIVFAHPTELGKPVNIWNNIKGATSITTNTAGDLIVTELEGNILKLEGDGTTSVLVSHSDSNLKHLESVATDDEGNVYCTDANSNKIMKCNKNGGNIRTYEVDQVKGHGHSAVTIVRNEVMLCERNNEGTVMIYDGELKYLRCIEYPGVGEFRRISADCHGNLYVTVCGKNTILVFNSNGVFRRSFEDDTNLNSPDSVCVCGHYMYVTNEYGNYVSVFTTAGDCITKFGLLDNGDSYFERPCDVCIGTDALIYIADYFNDRVLCF